MSKNNINALLDQQYGFSTWRESDSIFQRLRCTTKNAYTQLLPDEFYRDTPIFACKFAVQKSNEHFVALANEDGKLAVHNCETDTRFGVTAHNNAIFDLAWMFDQMKIVTASGDHTSKLYDVGNADIREVKVFCGHTRSVKTVAFRKEDSSVFASGGRDGNIILWDSRTDQSGFVGKADRTISNSHISKEFTPRKVRRKYNTPTNFGVKSVTGLVFQDQNTLISCGAGDGVIKVWDLRKTYLTSKREALPKWTIPYKGSTSKSGFSNLIVNDNGVLLYANCLDNTIYCYNIASYSIEPVMRYVGHQNCTFYIKSSLCKDGQYLLSGSSDENAYIWNTKYSTPLVKLTGHTAEVTCVAWCHKNQSLITCSDDMTHRIWKIGPEDFPKDWDLIGWGKAEVLPLEKHLIKRNLKRVFSAEITVTPKKFVVQCECCKNATASILLCENCNISYKRKADTEIASESKRFHNEFGPKRLFGNENKNIYNLEAQEHLADLLDKNNTHLSNSLNIGSNNGLESKQCSKLDNDVLKCPTVNLPNYVIDGTAPHLSYSPPKRKGQDWLTKIRIERNLRQEMIDRTTGPLSPKIPKLELTPKSKKSCTPKSPLLRFFKVTNSNNKCENNSLCSKMQHSCNFSSASSTELSQQ